MARPQDITMIEREMRVNAVKQMLLQGYTRSTIIKYCKDNYNVEVNTVDIYMMDAKAIIKEDFNALNDPETLVATIYGRLEDLFQKNEEISDYREQRNVLKDIRDMLGIDKATKQTIDLSVDAKLTKDQIDKLVDKL
jgi:hypothetical protein